MKALPLKLLKNEKGRLMEIQRVDDETFPGFGQAYITSTYPGVVKAWYRHQKQTDQIVCVTGAFKLVLYQPPTKTTPGEIQEIFLGDQAPATPQLVQIPPGIWHGFQNISNQEGFLLHLNTEPYNFDSPDEERLDPHDPLIPYTW